MSASQLPIDVTLDCVYCMSEDMQFLPRNEILTLEELGVIGKTFVEMGVKKIRLTGGEPLVRQNCIKLIQELGALEDLEELAITTNGSQLEKLAPEIKNAGVKRINISLDSLLPEKFKLLTRTKIFIRCLEVSKRQKMRV